jgi:hypothetical protein
MSMKKPVKRSAGPAATTPVAPKAGAGPAGRGNPRVQAQTRRVLVQHYRAKYGVK